MPKSQNGITLIALVVTIIVLLILAGVSITMVAGDNGIATKARKSAEATEIGTIKEDIKLEVSEKYTENLGILTEDEFVTILESYGTLSDEENVLDKTLTTDPDKTDTSKSYEIKVSDFYNGSFYEEGTTQYTVRFYAEDKTTVLQTVTVNSGEAVTFTGTEPTKTDYIFQYWVEDGETTEYELDSITEDVNLYPYFVADTGTTCFVVGTKVLTENGLMNIEEIKVGMKVYSYNLETEEVELKEVAEKYVNDATDDLGRVYVNGNIIESTVEHPYYVIGKGWTKVKDLNIGDKVQTVDGEELVIENLEISENTSKTTVYNIKVEDNHNYYVGDYCVLVHNKGHGSLTPM